MAHTRSDRDPDLVIPEENASCCFCFPRSWWQPIQTAQIQSDDRWWAPGVRAFKKIREWSEIVAGPKWKTFIRRFNRNKSSNIRHGTFQYDPLSYALNFDEGHGQVGNLEDVDDFDGFRDFSTRYASVSCPGKSVEVRNDVAVFG